MFTIMNIERYHKKHVTKFCCQGIKIMSRSSVENSQHALEALKWTKYDHDSTSFRSETS